MYIPPLCSCLLVKNIIKNSFAERLRKLLATLMLRVWHRLIRAVK